MIAAAKSVDPFLAFLGVKVEGYIKAEVEKLTQQTPK
jgi:hypothetical protein